MKTYVFIDLETSGLDPNLDRIVEIGWMYADAKMQRMTSTSYTAVQPVGAALERIEGNEVVRAMHSGTGLLDILRSGNPLPLLQSVEASIVAEMDELDDKYQMFKRSLTDEELAHASITEHMEFVLAGKNVHFDRSFIDRYMPRLSKRLSYRHFDETTLKYALEIVGMGVADTNTVTDMNNNQLQRHRAAFDVEMSFNVMKFMLQQIGEHLDVERFKDGHVDTYTLEEDGSFAPVDVKVELDKDLREMFGEG